MSNGYVGLADIAKKAKKFYIGIDDIAKEIIKIYIGDMNGKAKMFYSNSGGGMLEVPLELFDYSEYDDFYLLQGYYIDDWEQYYGNRYAYIPHQIDKKSTYIKSY